MIVNWNNMKWIIFWSNISSIRQSVSSPDETPRRELKIQHAVEYYWQTSRCFIWWWNTVSNAWYCFSNKMISEGEIKDTKLSSFSSDFQTLIEHQVPLYFLYELLMSLRTADKDMKVNMIFVIEDFQILFQPHRLFIQLWGSSFHFHLFTHSSKYDLFHIFSIPIISTMGYYMNSEWPALQRWLDSAQYIDTYRALCLVFAKVRVCFLVKPEFFRLLFNHLDYSF